MRNGIGPLVVAVTLSVPAAAQVVRVGLDAPKETDASATLDTAGSVAYTISTRDPFGTNPGLRRQIFRWDPATGAGTQVTAYDEGVASVSVSGDGTWLAFVSNADPLGTNHDESPELYVMQSNGTGLTQLTSFNLLPRPVRGLTRAVISGSANRIVFTGTIDPLGTNASLSHALFVVDRSGANLRQLATNVGDLVDISDDGSKVLYVNAGSESLAGINATGTGNHSFTTTTGVTEASLSGNGSKVAYALGTSFPRTLRARSFDGNPATIAVLGSGGGVSITDDGATVFHRRLATPDGIYRIASTGGAATLVAAGLDPLAVAGSGTRLVAHDTGLVALDATGGSVQQLAQPTIAPIEIGVQALSADGNHAWYLASVSPGADDPELFDYDFTTGVRSQRSGASVPRFTGDYFRASDGGDVFFMSAENPTFQNSCGAIQVFRLAATTNILTQITACGQASTSAVYPSVRGDGQIIVYVGVDGWNDLWRVNGDGGGTTRITTDHGSETKYSAVSEGYPEAWVAYVSDSNADGQNPSLWYQILRVRTDGSGWQRITTAGDAFNLGGPSISGDGQRIAWVSQANPVGQNSDGSLEVFVWDAATQGITQLTHDEEFSYTSAQITRDGAWVFAGARRISIASGFSEPATGFLHTTSLLGNVVSSASGGSWAFLANDVVDQSPSGMSLYRVQASVPPRIAVGKASPTVVTWDPSPDALRYDVVRGTTSALSIAGSAVDLGPVTCIEDDSPDNHTRGFEDPATPAPGEVFFYLYRGSVGFDAATGSYGQGSGGRERVAGAGGCNP